MARATSWPPTNAARLSGRCVWRGGNVEFLKQREARLETARKAREEQELAQLAAPELTEGSRRLVHGSYAPPWAGKSAKVSCRAQKVLQAAIESKAQEEAEHTFRPQINARSKAIFRPTELDGDRLFSWSRRNDGEHE